MFVLGFLSALVLLAVSLWLGRDSLMHLITFGYQHEDRQVVLLKDFRLYQHGVEVGRLKSGTQFRFDGLDKTSPIENYSIIFGWENRGADREKLFREPSDSRTVFTELVPVEAR